MSIAVKYECKEGMKDIVLYAGKDTTMKDLQDEISRRVGEVIKVLYVKF